MTVSAIASASATAGRASCAAHDAAAVVQAVQRKLGVHPDLIEGVKRASVRIGLLDRAKCRLLELGSGTIIDAGAGAPRNQVLTVAHLFVDPVEKTKDGAPNLHHLEPTWTKHGFPAAIDWTSDVAPLILAIGMWEADDQPSRWMWWAELVTPLATLQEKSQSPHAPHSMTHMLDLAVLRICGRLELTPDVFQGFRMDYSVVAKHQAMASLAGASSPLPAGLQLGDPDALQVNADLITVFGWFSPAGEVTLFAPQALTLAAKSHGLLQASVMLHSGGSGGAAVDHRGRLVAVNWRSDLPALPPKKTYMAYMRMTRGTDLVLGSGIAYDGAGGALVTGYFSGQASFGSTSLTSRGTEDAFVMHVTASGAIDWAVQAGDRGLFADQDDHDSSSSTSHDPGYCIAHDGAGGAFVTGFFMDGASFGSTLLKSRGLADAFVMHVTASGVIDWAVQAGGANVASGRGIAHDGAGGALVTGYFSGQASFGSTSLTSRGNTDAFVMHVTASGAIDWAVQAGGESVTSGRGIAHDGAGGALVTGYFKQMVDSIRLPVASFGSTSLTAQGSADAFVMHVTASGAIDWAVQAGGADTNTGGYGIAHDGAGGALVTGDFNGKVSFGSTSLTGQGDCDAFVMHVTASGAIDWAVQAGGASVDRGWGIAHDVVEDVARSFVVQVWAMIAANMALFKDALELSGTTEKRYVHTLDELERAVTDFEVTVLMSVMAWNEQHGRV
ncbi:pkd domain-containing protein [Chrysochromulina tobinii]|uniref:Pkd domain-containing protein n=1 Tax=Chrysochromulina tobinii TaxID=1460289 RepID=A0A0M0JN77_9EUKA|nr:pkd domain-containing protein [Chrysochromulina tobinii]|eukprot:KOO27777.1 pkd domain-containing protein [Chrysochromulina sp. CCMP291]